MTGNVESPPIADERAGSGIFSTLWAGLTRGREYAPPGANTLMGQLLWSYPPPLIDPANKLLVIFSAKSACTNVLVWFFHHLGHAKAVRDYHPSPHQYRTQVYYRSRLYQRAYNLKLDKFTVIRIIRDPSERAASAFRHMLRHSTAKFGQRLGMSHLAKTGMSFSEYLDFLDRLDLRKCDAHFAVQNHPIEKLLSPKYTINVSTEDLYQRLNVIERDLGLERTELGGSDWVQRIDRRNRPAAQLEPAGDLYTQRLTAEQAAKGPWPLYEDLLTSAARERIKRLYAVDFAAYGIQ